MVHTTLRIRYLTQLLNMGFAPRSDPFPISTRLQIPDDLIEGLHNMYLRWINEGKVSEDNMCFPRNWMMFETIKFLDDNGYHGLDIMETKDRNLAIAVCTELMPLPLDQ